MTIITKASAKNYFLTGNFPTQSNFADTIDSYLGLGETASQTVSGPLVFSGSLTFGSSITVSGDITATGGRITASAATVTSKLTGATASYSGLVSADAGINATSITFGTTTGIVGTTTNNDAAAGSVGEYISSSIAIGSAVSFVNGTPKDITTISLTAGDWDVWGSAISNPAAGTTTSDCEGWINTTTATKPGLESGYTAFQVSMAANAIGAMTIPPIRLSITTPTTVYLSAQFNFSVSTLTAYGSIKARRRR